jgi:diacylglycerol kinase (ATP)
LYISGRISSRASRLWRVLGPLRYVAAALTELAVYRSQPGVWRLADGTVSTGQYLLAEICNGPRTGGGFYLVPGADATDGQLDICLVHPLSFLGALRLLPRVMSGQNVEHPAIVRMATTGGTLELPEPVTVHVDGEPGPLPAGCYPVRVDPGALRVVVPGPPTPPAGVGS